MGMCLSEAATVMARTARDPTPSDDGKASAGKELGNIIRTEMPAPWWVTKLRQPGPKKRPHQALEGHGGERRLGGSVEVQK